MNNPRLPNFLIVGSGRCGTTSLTEYLSKHPQIYIPEIKEPRYFISPILKNINKDDPSYNYLMETSIFSWQKYTELFNSIDSKVHAIGEASVQYLYHYNITIPEIKKTLGDVKIIIMLRNPADRAFSNYMLHRKNDMPTFEEALEEEDKRRHLNYNSFWFYYDMGLYYKQVQAFKASFTDVKIILFEDFIANTLNSIKDVFTFLGVDNLFIPSFAKAHNITGIPKNRFLNYIFYQDNIITRIRRKITNYIFPHAVTKKIKSYLKRKTLVKNKITFNDATRFKLQKKYQNDILQLSTLIGENLNRWL